LCFWRICPARRCAHFFNSLISILFSTSMLKIKSVVTWQKICDIIYVIFPQQYMHKLCRFFYELNILQKFWHKICFLLATYGIWGKYWFRVEKNEIFLLLIFTFYDFLWLNNMIWAIKYFPSVTRRCRCRCRCRNLSRH
jgi:hypothetical protein